MEIRKTRREDVARVLEIYEFARNVMRSSGNAGQWKDGYPSETNLLNDIASGGSYVVVDDDGNIVGTFYFVIAPEPTYAQIYEGRWANDSPYGVIHRVASDGSVKGLMQRVLDYCFTLTDNIRIDTHRNNVIMQRSLRKYGFGYCGIIHLANGDERLAFQLQKILQKP